MTLENLDLTLAAIIGDALDQDDDLSHQDIIDLLVSHIVLLRAASIPAEHWRHLDMNQLQGHARYAVNDAISDRITTAIRKQVH